MKSSSSWPQNSLTNRMRAIQELTQGRLLTDWLREMIGQPEKIESCLESVDDALVRILGVYGNTVSVFSSGSVNSDTVSFNPSDDDHVSSPNSWDDKKFEDFTKNGGKVKRGCYKRSKNPVIYTEVTFNLVDDGYGWRKYGQKEIINSKHQRQYYRCTHKYEQGCKATKQVQMIDDKPSKYKITYHGHHTCNNSQRSPKIILDSPNPNDDSVLISFETTSLTTKKQVAGFSPSPTTQKPNNSFRSQSIIEDKVFSIDSCMTRDGITLSSKHSSEPISSTMSYGMDMSINEYEIHDMVLKDDFGVGLFSGLCS